MKTFFRLFLCTILSLCSTVTMAHGNNYGFGNEDSLAHQREIFAQEKVYVMSDRQLYATGDTVWFRGWIVDGETLKEKQMSRYLYVELRDPVGKLMNRVRIMVNEKGIYEGYLPLDITLPSNQYTINAYTYYMLGTHENFFFKKQIDVIRPEDLAKGATTTALANRKYPENYMVLSEVGSNDVTFDVVPNASYAVSITNFSMDPSNEMATITYNLPKQPNLFEKDSFNDNMGYIYPTFPYEQGNVVSGTVYGNFSSNKPQKETNVTVVGLTMGMGMNDGMTDEKGHFSINLPEFTDSTTFLVQAKKKNHVMINIEFDKPILPEKISALPVMPKHFTTIAMPTEEDMNTKMWAQKLKNDQSILLDEVIVREKKLNTPIYDFHKQTTRTKIYTSEESFRHVTYAQFLEQLGIHGTSYHSHPVSFYFDGQKVPMDNGSGNSSTIGSLGLEDTNSVQMSPASKFVGAYGNGSVNDMLSAFYPPFMVKAVEILDPMEAMGMQGRGYEHETYVVNFIIKKGSDLNLDDHIYDNYKIYIPLGAQKSKAFSFEPSKAYAAPVIYWNPAIVSDSNGKLNVQIPENSNSGYTYRITVEGISDKGELIHHEKFVKM